MCRQLSASDITGDEAETEEALAEFDFLMPDAAGKLSRPGAAGSQGRPIVCAKLLLDV